MLLYLGEPLVRLLCCCCCSFLMCILICWCSSFCCCCSSFISRLLFHVTGTLSWLLRSVKASNCSELYPNYFLIAFSFSSCASATVLSGHFLPTRVFYLTLLPDSFGTTCFYQGLPGSRQVFLEVCRDSYWSSKHSLVHLFVWFIVIHNPYTS